MDPEEIKLTLTGQTPALAHFTINDKERGERHFVRDGESYTEITKEPIQPVRCHRDRRYTMLDSASFVAAVKKYGDPEKGIIFYSEKGIIMHFDHLNREEHIRTPFRSSLERNQILNAGQGAKFSQKGFLKIIETFPECFPESSVLLANVQRFEATVNTEILSDIDPQNTVFTYQEKSGKQTARFPKKLQLTMPYFEGATSKMTFMVDLDITTPKTADERVQFQLTHWRCERTLWEAVRAEVADIEKKLAGWLFLFTE